MIIKQNVINRNSQFNKPLILKNLFPVRRIQFNNVSMRNSGNQTDEKQTNKKIHYYDTKFGLETF